MTMHFLIILDHTLFIFSREYFQPIYKSEYIIMKYLVLHLAFKFIKMKCATEIREQSYRYDNFDSETGFIFS